jgi:hypothetical protein
LFAFLLACGGGDSYSPLEFCDDFVDGVCEFVAACGGDEAECRRQIFAEVGDCASIPADEFCDPGESFSAAQAEDCIAALERLECTDESLPGVCDRVCR